MMDLAEAMIAEIDGIASRLEGRTRRTPDADVEKAATLLRLMKEALTANGRKAPASRRQAGEAALMRISLRDQYGKELDFASVTDVREAPAEAMLLLARCGCLYPGSLLIFDDDSPSREPGAMITLTTGHLQSLAGRLEQQAGVIDVSQPLYADDLRTAARFCRHALKVGWVGKTSIAIA